MLTTEVEPDLTVQISATPEQQEMILCEAPFQFWVAGRRWGKTLTERHKLVEFGLKYPGEQFYYIALSYSKAKTEFRRFWQATQNFVVWKSLQPHPEIHWFNGSQFRFLSFDRPDNMRGEGVKLIIGDEASKFPEASVWEVLQPMTADVDGTMILGSTFYGENWYYKEFLKGLDPKYANEYKSFIYPTPTGFAFQGDAGIKRLERIQRTIPGAVWDQEYMCKPSVGQDAVFRFVERAVKGIPAMPQAEPGRRYLCAWDTGRKEDPSAILVMDDAGRVCHFEIMPLMMEEGKQLERVADVVKRYGAVLVIDSTGAGTKDWIVGFARQRIGGRVESMYMRAAEKEVMVRELAVQIESSTPDCKAGISIPASFTDLIMQLRSYRYEMKGNRYEYGAPQGLHDDGVAALLMACMGRKNGMINPSVSASANYAALRG